MVKWAVYTGNPFDGMTMIGPFDSPTDADEISSRIDDEWGMVKIVSPKEYFMEELEDDEDETRYTPEQAEELQECIQSEEND